MSDPSADECETVYLGRHVPGPPYIVGDLNVKPKVTFFLQSDKAGGELNVTLQLLSPPLDRDQMLRKSPNR